MKRKTKYVANGLTATTKRNIIKKINNSCLDYQFKDCWKSTVLVHQQRPLGFIKTTIKPINQLLNCSSIRKMWKLWNKLIGEIIPDGFQVLVNKYDRIPTALEIRNKVKRLVATPYDCYLLDRDLRRYLGLPLRHPA